MVMIGVGEEGSGVAIRYDFCLFRSVYYGISYARSKRCFYNFQIEILDWLTALKNAEFSNSFDYFLILSIILCVVMIM